MDSDVAHTDKDSAFVGNSEGVENQIEQQPQPRSRRVGMQLTNPPPNLILDLATTYTSTNTINTPPPPSTPTTTSDKPLPPRPLQPVSPPVPARSPLRPPPRRSFPSPISISPSSSGDSQKSNTSADSLSGHTPITNEPTEESPLEAPRAESIMSITKLLDEINSSSSLIVQPSTMAMMNGTMSKSMSVKSSGSQRPESPPLPTPPSTDEPKEPKQKAKAMTKRQHALHELLSSERAYASDLALIREVHIPLAMGLPASFSTPAPSNEIAQVAVNNTSRTLSTASSSTTSSASTNFSSTSASTTATSISPTSTFTPFSTSNPPLSASDAKIIFSNIEDLAIFSDKFCDLLEEALGQEVEGGQGEDRVGDLFCKVIYDLEPPYMRYITKHPTSLARLTALTTGLAQVDDPSSQPPDPSQPPLAAYLSLTKQIASTHSHAWDLPSLLIKPVQRLMKYPLLLQAIIDATPYTHSDYAKLKDAKERMEEVARAVNEGRRRKEVVREVLERGMKGGGVGLLGLKDIMGIEAIGSIGGFVGVAGGGGKKKGLGKMKGLKSPSKGGSGGGGGGGEEGESGLPMSLSHNGSTATLIPSSASASGFATLSNETNEESREVLRLAVHLDQTYAFLHAFAKEMIDWARAMRRSVEGLEVWARAFGRVIGLKVDGDLVDSGVGSYDEAFVGGTGGSALGSVGAGTNGIGGGGSGGGGGGQGEYEEEALQSEAFDEFLNVVHSHLLPLAAKLESEIQTRILAPISKLVQSMNEPKILINAMNAARPIHEHLLHTPISSSSSSLASLPLSGSSSSKNRPSPALLHASSTYLALRGQLAKELPFYVGLLDLGVAGAIREWVDLQAGYWREVRMRWEELWELLRVEGEGNRGARETIGIWEGRWKEVEAVVNMLGIVRPVVGGKEKKEKEKESKKDKKEKEKGKEKLRGRSGSVGAATNVNLGMGVTGTLGSLEAGRLSSGGSSRGRGGMGSGSSMMEGSGSSRAGGVASMLASLDPALPYAPHHGSGSYASSYGSIPSPGFGQGGLPYVSGPLPLTPRGRTRGASDAPLRHVGSSMIDMPSAMRREPSVHGDMSMSMSLGSSRHSGGSGGRGGTGGGVFDHVDESLGMSAARSAQAKRGSSRSRRDQQQQHQVDGGDYRVYGVGDPGYGEYGVFEEYQKDMEEYLVAMGLRESSAMEGAYDEFAEYVAVGGGPVQPTPTSSASMPKPTMQPRTKSMPTLTQSSTGNTEAPSARSSASSKILGDERERERDREEKERDRGRTSRKPSLRRKFTDSLRSSHSSSSSIQNQAQQQQQQYQNQPPPQSQSQSRRHRSPSAKSVNETYFYVDPDAPPTPASNMTSFPSSVHQGYASSNHSGGMASRKSWSTAPAKYACQVVHSCTPPPGVSYFSYPFFRLVEGQIYEVLHEAGHPSVHPKLPLHVDDGADCLLLVRDVNSAVGWALASFLIPLEDI